MKSVLVKVYGIVQGVGFRPTVANYARTCNVHGNVCNKGDYVEIFAQGLDANVNDFLRLITHSPPKRAIIVDLQVCDVPKKIGLHNFEIIISDLTVRDKKSIFIPPDIAICDDCMRELYDKNNRRYLHPFINCTSCGPRMTILDNLPYDRVRTSMKKFAMCPQCESEYYNPDTRRFDAQPVCCNDCGPVVYLINNTNNSNNSNNQNIFGRQAIAKARQHIINGDIVAVKGIGGFHLCCDARNKNAVSTLRKRKNRPSKPFAVMFKNLDAVKKECVVTLKQQEILTGYQRPILLLDKKNDSTLSDNIAPDNAKLGVMLPYAPLQMLLFENYDGLQMSDALIMTSGNISGSPICKTDSDVFDQLSGFIDCTLSHNRDILIRADDSVVDFYDNNLYMVRRSRGYAPLPIVVKNAENTENSSCSLAIGGELKNTFCINKNNFYYLSPFIGDLSDYRTVTALQESVVRFCNMLEVKPNKIICDMHPLYNSVSVAQDLADKYKIKLVQVQHHYAHILACMAENDCNEKVIGVSFDGTGYGTDKTIWGGEVLIADRYNFKRINHIDAFLQIGGDASSREGWRIAVSMIYGIVKDKNKVLDILQKLNICDKNVIQSQFVMYNRKINAMLSTSVGRLFDAVSALLNICKKSSFEGEAANKLQYYALQYNSSSYSYQNFTSTKKLFEYILREILEDSSTQNIIKLAYAFHAELSHIILNYCLLARNEYNINIVALSGGCFQNTLLLDLSVNKLKNNNFNVLLHKNVPPNDGGISLGQAYYCGK